MNEITIPSEQIQIPSFDEQFEDISNQARKNVLMQDSAKGLLNRPDALLENLREESKKNTEEMILDGVDSYQERMDGIDGDLLGEAAIQSPDFGVEVFNRIDEKRQKDLSQNPLFLLLRENVLKTPGSEKLSSRQVDQAAAYPLLMYGFAEAWDNMGMARKAGDLANILLWPDLSYNVAMLGRGLAKEFDIEDWEHNITDQMELVQQMASFRGRLEGDALLVFDEKVVEILNEIELSVLQKMHLADAIAGRYGDMALDLSLDKADVAIIVATAGAGLLARVLKASQLMTRLGAMGDSAGAMKAADLAKDPEAARVMGVLQTDAASLGHPGVTRDVMHGMPPGPSTEYRHYISDLEDVLDKAWNVTSINLATETPEEAVRIAAALRKHLPDDLQVDNIKIAHKDGQTRIEYDIMDADNAVISRESLPYTLDEVGTYQDVNVGLGGSVLRPLLSPAYIQGTDAAQLVDSALVGVNLKANLGSIYTKAAEKALKPVKGNKASLERISKVLNEIDGKHIENPYHTLTNVGVGGVRFTDKEFTVWAGLRRVLDDIYMQNDRAMRQELEFGRASAVRDDIGETVFARPFPDSVSAEAAWHGDQTSTRLLRITDDGAEEMLGASLKDLDELYKDGFVLTRAHMDDSSSWFMKGEGPSQVRYRFALVKGNRLEGIPETGVLNKTPNYLPKLNKDANFFIKEERMVDVGGRQTISKPITLAYAATRKQAEKYLDAVRRADEEIGITRTIGITEDVLHTSQANGDAVKAMGGLIRGKRSKEGIEYAGDIGGGRADPLESITRAISLTADRVAMSRWRLAETDRWYKSAKNLHSELPSDWLLARTAIEGLPPSAAKTKLLSAHDHISDMRMIPTKSEKMFQGAIVSAAKLLDKSDNAFLQRSAVFFYQIKDHNPIGLMKSMAFNLTLGTFSMVQIPVQAFGSLVAVAANPVYAGRAMSSWIMAAGLDLGTDMKVVKETTAILGKRMGMGPEKTKSFENDYSFWRASGMREAVVRGSADATAVMNGLPMDAGMLRRIANSVITAGQTPYRMGELANMRISFFTALERQKAIDGASFLYDNNTMKKVLSRAEHYRMNMHSANKAAYQRGIWALPTQFKQIYTKYIEALAGRTFTPAEKLRIMSVQATVFGAAGIPIINHFTDQIMKHTGLTEADLDHETYTLMRHGSFGYLTNEVWGLDMASSGRLTVSADLIDEMTRIFVEGRTPLLEIMMGASGTPLKHSAGAFSSMLLAGNMVINAEEESPAVLAEAFAIIAEGFGRIPSSGRKVIEAMDLAEGLVRKSDGTPLYRVMEPKTWDVIWRGFGFGSLKTEEVYKERMIERNVKEDRAAKVDQLLSAFHTIVRGAEKEDHGRWRAGQIAASMVMSQIDRYPPDEAERIRDAFRNKLINGTDMYETTVRSYIERFHTDSVNAFNSAYPVLIKERQKREKQGQQILQEYNE